MIKPVLILALAASTAACSPLAFLAPPKGDDTSTADVIREVASDPRCGHVDRLQGNLGGLGGNNLSIFLERTCPPQIVPLRELGSPQTQEPRETGASPAASSSF